MGSAVLQTLDKNFTVNNSLLQKKVGIWVLKANTHPAILIECGYLDNDEDLKILNDRAKIELMARKILEGVALYANQKIEPSQIHNVQVE